MKPKLAAHTHKYLSKLADFIEKQPTEHFHMDSFFYHESAEDLSFGSDHAKVYGDTLRPRDLHTCGTTACAFGYACVAPALKPLGISHKVNKAGHVVLFYRGSRRSNYWPVVRAVFKITEAQAEYLFAANSFTVRTPKDWAKYCRAFLAVEGDLSVLAPMEEA